MQVLTLLNEGDRYFCFDFENSIKDFIADVRTLVSRGMLKVNCEILGLHNSDKEWDSYNWNLSNLLLDMRSKKINGIFDVVYLDGAHTFLHDGLAVCMLKELIRQGGFLVLDDLFWSYSESEWGRGYGPTRLTKQQMDDKQILRVQEIFLTHDTNFVKLSDDKSYRGIFRRIK